MGRGRRWQRRRLMLFVGIGRDLLLVRRRRWWRCLVLLVRWWLILLLPFVVVVVVAVVVVVVAAVCRGGRSVSTIGFTIGVTIVGSGGSGDGGNGGNVCLTVRVCPRLLPASWCRREVGGLAGSDTPGDMWRGPGGLKVPWRIHSPRAKLMHVPQLVAVLASLSRVRPMRRRLVIKRAGKVRWVSRVVVAAGREGV